MMNRNGYGQRPTAPYGPVGRMGHGREGLAQNRGCGCAQRANTVTRNGCGCGQDNCKRLMEEIQRVDFALYETVLYLDVYPNSCEALDAYHRLKCQSEALHAQYEESCGPLTAFGNQSKTAWSWMDQPLPWAYDAK